MLIIASPDSPLASALSLALAEVGISTLRVTTAIEATALTRHAPPLAIAVQVGAGFPEGIRLIESLRTADCPIIVLAEPDEGSAVTRVLDRGADNYLTAVPTPAQVQMFKLTARQPTAPA